MSLVELGRYARNEAHMVVGMLDGHGIDAVLFDGEATQVITRTTEGDVAFLSGHAPFLGTLAAGETRVYLADGSVQRFDIDIFETSGGGARHDRVRIHKDNLEVVATTAHDTQLLALRYLSCQPVPGGG